MIHLCSHTLPKVIPFYWQGNSPPRTFQFQSIIFLNHFKTSCTTFSTLYKAMKLARRGPTASLLIALTITLQGFKLNEWEKTQKPARQCENTQHNSSSRGSKKVQIDILIFKFQVGFADHCTGGTYKENFLWYWKT
jgi:hypothetical protein